MPRKSLTFDEVLELARALPGIEADGSTIRGAPSLRLGGKLLACPALHKSADADSLVVKIGIEERARLIAEDPDVYYVTDHYVNYPSVLVRLSRIHRDALRDLLGMSARFLTTKSKPKKRSTRRSGAPHV
jgi:hypothetical protein